MWTFQCKGTAAWILLSQPAEKTLLAARSTNIPFPSTKKEESKKNKTKQNNTILSLTSHGTHMIWPRTNITPTPHSITLQRKCLTCSNSRADLWRVEKGSADPGAACRHLSESQFSEVDGTGKRNSTINTGFLKTQYMTEETQGIIHSPLLATPEYTGVAIFKLPLSIYIFISNGSNLHLSLTVVNPQKALQHL